MFTHSGSVNARTPHLIKEVYYIENAFKPSFMSNIPETYERPHPTICIPF